MTSLRDQLARFHAAITGRAPLDSARELVEAGRAVPPDSREVVEAGRAVPSDSREVVEAGRALAPDSRDVVESERAGVRVDELERLHVYEHAYTARIASVLVHDYPKLAKLVGDDVLRAWTASYLRAYPPSNFSLREVGANLAQWLEKRDAHVGASPGVEHDAAGASRDERADHDDRSRPMAVFAGLARIERARTEVFDGPDSSPLAREDLASMDPAEFPSLKLRLVPSSRVVEIATNADDVWDAIENDQTLQITPATKRTVLVWRRELTVIHRTLEADEARIIPTMIAGTTFGAMCELLDEETAAERAIELLVRWLDAQILATS